MSQVGKDVLTGLANRRELEAVLDDEIHTQLLKSRDDGALCVVVFDIDDFKSINDDYGRDEGDRGQPFPSSRPSHVSGQGRWEEPGRILPEGRRTPRILSNHGQTTAAVSNEASNERIA